MLLFAFATLAPLPLLCAAALSGGWWVAAALLYMTGFTYLLDQLVRIVPAPSEGMEFPAADTLSVVLALAHFALLGLVIVTIGTRAPLEAVGLIVAAGLYLGQVSNSNAHELIHRGARPLHLLGRWVFISMLYGHHASAHPLIHHRHVATPEDPATARLGEGFWSYIPRAWGGAFRAGLRAERARLDRIGRSRLHNPYVQYVAGSLAFCTAALALGGLPGLLAFLTLAAYAQAQLMLSDYVQHYGLTRKRQPGGKFEPVGAAHSWNAPRHSDHHAHPARPYPELRLDADAPALPRSLPAMATLALVPPLWRRVMDQRVRSLA